MSHERLNNSSNHSVLRKAAQVLHFRFPLLKGINLAKSNEEAMTLTLQVIFMRQVVGSSSNFSVDNVVMELISYHFPSIWNSRVRHWGKNTREGNCLPSIGNQEGEDEEVLKISSQVSWTLHKNREGKLMRTSEIIRGKLFLQGSVNLEIRI